MNDNSWMWEKTKTDSSYSGMDRGYGRTLGMSDNAKVAGEFNFKNPDQGNVTATSRVIPSPSGTNWDATFGASQRPNGVNAPSSPSGTDWQKTFGGQRSNGFSGSSRQSGSDFSFNLSPASDRSQLNIATPATDFYKDRVANMDLTKRDHDLYGAGSHYGFAF